ncbi:MAG: tetratricopeptide repeat protein [Bacteroidales bacterium]
MIEYDSLDKARHSQIGTKEFIFKNLSRTDRNLAMWYSNEGKINYNKGDYQESIIYYDSSLSILELNGLAYQQLYSIVLDRKGLSYKELAKYNDAIKCFRTNLEFYDSNTNQYYEELIKGEYSDRQVYSLLFKVDSSKIYLMRALSLQEDMTLFHIISFKNFMKVWRYII